MCRQYEFKGRRWKRLSAQAKALVEDLLVVDPEDRATAEEALRASWLNRRYAATVRNAYTEEIDRAKNCLLKYTTYSKLKKMALMVVAHKSTSEDIGILRKVFNQYDTKRDGILNFDEFKAAVQAAGYSELDYQTLFKAVVRPSPSCLRRALNFAPQLSALFCPTGFGRNRKDSIHRIPSCND